MERFLSRNIFKGRENDRRITALYALIFYDEYSCFGSCQNWLILWKSTSKWSWINNSNVRVVKDLYLFPSTGIIIWIRMFRCEFYKGINILYPGLVPQSETRHSFQGCEHGEKWSTALIVPRVGGTTNSFQGCEHWKMRVSCYLLLEILVW